MINGIKEKLKLELSKPITEESQVVYILSRMRKILEIDEDKNQGKYTKLKFYCDWALHAKIDRTKAFQEEFEKFIQGDLNAGASVITYQVFETEFLAFLNQYEISANIYRTLPNNLAFKEFLAKIYSETPIIVTFTKKFKIKTNEGIFTVSEKGAKMEIGFNITSLD